ncbi:ribosomal protein S12 methylthiotransferase accessory factor [Chitinophaga sp. CF118]|uniref:TOMM precursor leader peptide-binding protein n=1 Tax=Chitinophaga sp. CF118 TaxID=1884367 RepID=UPI0008F3EF41|nr:TOMM precursor leader peptide-binding protein [Chitinophaga sp. CF118]SFD26341.1 ribosomal protein S12 methylthiotransferase accessory factor [Chitinophaga sp. CF118]
MDKNRQGVGMDDIYMLSPDLSYAGIGNTWGFIIGCRGIYRVEGILYIRILQLLSTGSFSVGGLIDFFKKEFVLPHVLHAVATLSSQGYIIRDADFIQEKYLLREQIPLPVLPERYSVSCHGDLDDVHAESAYQEALSRNEIWLPVIYGAGYTFAGPFFSRASGLCLECLRWRVKQNSSVLNWIAEYTNNAVPIPLYVPVSLVNMLNAGIVELAGKWVPDGPFGDKMITLDTTGNPVFHLLTRRPECKVCGDPLLVTRQMNQSFFICNTGTGHADAPGYRTVTPADTWEKMKHHINPVAGILSELRTITAEDEISMYVYGAVFPDTPVNDKPEAHEFYKNAFGKGSSALASKVSALCESIERRSARYRGDEPIFSSSLEELRPYAVAPYEIQHFHVAQLLQPEATHALGPVPVKLTDGQLINWLPAWSLRDQERRYIPAEAVLYGLPGPENNRVAIFESNGLSAGNTREEAILQGLLELIERDATAIWWFNGLRRPAFNTDIMEDDSWFHSALQQLTVAGWSVHFLDLTIDTVTPVVAAVGCFSGGFLAGYGCHFDPHTAIIRSLTELIQIRALMKPIVPPAGLDTDFLYPSANARVIVSEQYDFIKPPVVSEMCTTGITRLSRLGIDTIIVDCTRPDIGLPVIKVFAPGLRAFRPRFASGRLYEIPVTLGIADKILTYSEMNPLWMTPQAYHPDKT